MSINRVIFNLLVALMLCHFAYAEGDSSGGDGFRETAGEYNDMAEAYANEGKFEIASLYKRMAQIKLHAAELGDEERWDDIDWSEYGQIEEKIDQLKQKYKHKR